jgi:hypothetical protein
MAGWASILALALVPIAANAAERALASARLTVEPSVGASLSGSVAQGLLVQILPGVRADGSPAATPGMVLTFQGTEVVTDSAVSLRVEHRAATFTPPDLDGEQAESGALLVLAQFN